MQRRRFLSLAPPALLASCTPEQQADAPPKLPKPPWRIYSTTQFTANLVALIGGEAVESRCFLPEAVSAWDFQPAAPDFRKLFTADMVITHGLGLEDRWETDLKGLAGSGVRVYSATAAIPADRILRRPGGGEKGQPDPHVWMNPALAVLMVNAVEAALTDVMPKLAGHYFKPAAHRIRMELEDALAFGVKRAQELGKAARFLLTSHDSMRYFAAAFGMESRALTAADGVIPEQLSPDLETWIRENRVKSLFREFTTDARALRNLLDKVNVNPDQVIYTRALPPPGTQALVSFKSYDAGLAAGSVWQAVDIIISTLKADG